MSIDTQTGRRPNLGDKVRLPTPLQDRVDAANGDLAVLNAVERTMLVDEKRLTAAPGVVIGINAPAGFAWVSRGGHGRFKCPLDNLRVVGDRTV